MNYPARSLLVLLALFSAAPLMAAETPEQALRAFLDDCQNRRTEPARARVLIVEGDHPQAGQAHVDEMINGLGEWLPPGQTLTVVDSRATANAAVIIARLPNDRVTAQTQELYLVRDGENWRILPAEGSMEKVTNLAPQQKADLAQLQTWYQQRSRELQQKATIRASSQSKLVSDLILACIKGDMETVDRLIAQGVDVNAAGHSRETALQSAAQFGKTEMVRKLIVAGASVDPPGKSPLILAISSRQPETAAVLIESGADINRELEGRTPLEAAVAEGQSQSVSLLLAKGAEPRAPVKPPTATYSRLPGPHTTLLNLAVASGDYATFDLVRPLFPDLRVTDAQGINALHYVGAMFGRGEDHARITRELLKAGVDPHALVEDGFHRIYEIGKFTPLQVASMRGKPDVLLVLLNDVKYSPEQLTESLLRAARWNSAEAVEKLVDCGASTAVPEDWYQTPLHASVQRYDLRKVQILLDHGAPIDRPNKKTGRTALLDAVAGSTPQIVAELLKRGANLEAKDAAGDDVASLVRIRLEKGRATNTGNSYLPEFPNSPDAARQIAEILKVPAIP